MAQRGKERTHARLLRVYIALSIQEPLYAVGAIILNLVLAVQDSRRVFLDVTPKRADPSKELNQRHEMELDVKHRTHDCCKRCRICAISPDAILDVRKIEVTSRVYESITTEDDRPVHTGVRVKEYHIPLVIIYAKLKDLLDAGALLLDLDRFVGTEDQ